MATYVTRAQRRRRRCLCAWGTLTVALTACMVWATASPLRSWRVPWRLVKQSTDPQAQDQSGAQAANGGTAQRSDKTGTGIMYEYEEDGVRKQGEILDIPIPEDCHAEQAADYGGIGVTWGLNYKKESAAACCQACKDHANQNPSSQPCNAWVWCGQPGFCWTVDIHNHTTGACWLKHQPDWDGNFDLAATNLEINSRGAFEAAFRNEHTTAPERVAWIAGTIAYKRPG